VGASLALGLSEAPFEGPLGACRIALIGDRYVVNPTLQEVSESQLDLVISGTETGITMIEAVAKEVSEDEVMEALHIGYEQVLTVIGAQKELITKFGLPKKVIQPPPFLYEIEQYLRENYGRRIDETVAISGKSERQVEMRLLEKQAQQEVREKFEKTGGFVPSWEKIVKEKIRDLVIDSGRRQDGRTPGEIRPVSCEVGVLPRTHGSALFTRGQTQSLVITTLGASSEEQKVDGLQDEEARRFMLHYNFPSFSVGEVRPMRGPGRREVGHGALAERALEYFIPPEENFPYTIRVVSEILESNGSSSMASVCGSSLSLMDAGVPVKKACAGLSIGLIRSGNRRVLLRDILGSEDHYGEMDFKVAGSSRGITAIQLDVKNTGLELDLFRDALAEAREGRAQILEIMNSVIDKPRSALSSYAPKIAIIEINPDKIGAVIGPGGKVIKKIVEETGADIDIQDDGRIIVFSRTNEGKEKAIELIKSITQEVEIGKVYLGKVVRITDFGAFVEIFPGRDGLCHISQFSRERIRKVEDVVNVGDNLLVKVVGIDAMGKISLSHKEATSNTGLDAGSMGNTSSQERRGRERDRGRPHSPKGR
ncbi:MAG TPA: polyribonucleotide nucleotidyltransferase, partial [Atribacteraceae bacterium]|nr:polyribonucleotide nucleotidyltransferase [Atribacteraceae bacterium]